MAHAAIIWDWSFPEENITLTPTETFYIGGTLSNHISSTENLRINAYSWWISGGDLGNNDFFGDVYTYNSTASSPGGLFYNNQPTNIAPGSDYTFSIANFIPIVPPAIGTEFSWTLQLFHDFDGPSEQSLTRTISATIISAIPAPSSILLMLAGIIFWIATKRKYEAHNK